MLKCPNCDSILEQDFGMVTCGECQSVLMIDLSGQVQMGNEQEGNPQTDGEGYSTEVDDDSTDPPEESYTEPEDFESVQTLDSDYANSDEDETYSEQDQNSFSDDFDPIESDMEQMEADQEEATDHNFTDGEDSEAFAEPSTVSEEDSIEAFEDSTNNDFFASSEEPDADEEVYDEPEDEVTGSSVQEPEEAPESFPIASEPDPDPVDITDYANSEVSSLEDGEFLYDVTISRLDSKDLKEALKYVLLDEKLKINHHEYLKKIRDGKVTIPDLNPIKAKRIVEQLQYQEVNITWKQKRVVMELVEPDTDVEGAEEQAEDLNA